MNELVCVVNIVAGCVVNELFRCCGVNVVNYLYKYKIWFDYAKLIIFKMASTSTLIPAEKLYKLQILHSTLVDATSTLSIIH